MKYTMKDIAKECNVGVMTVSRAFRNDASIKPETRKKVLEVAEKHAYIPNISARNLKSSGSRVIGWIIPNVNNSFYLNLIPYIQERLNANDYSLVVDFITSSTNEFDALQNIMASRPEVVISSEKCIKQYQNITEPIFDTKFIQFTGQNTDNNTPKLLINDNYGTQIATEHLICNGHKRIAFCGTGPRVEDYMQTMAENGLSYEGLVCPEANNITKLIDFFNKEKPTAVLSFGRGNIYVYAAITQAHLNIPNDISIVMYDDSSLAQLLDIDVIAHPMENVANELVHLILESVNLSSNDHVLSLINPTLIIRNSVKNISSCIEQY